MERAKTFRGKIMYEFDGDRDTPLAIIARDTSGEVPVGRLYHLVIEEHTDGESYMFLELQAEQHGDGWDGVKTYDRRKDGPGVEKTKEQDVSGVDQEGRKGGLL